MIAVEEYTATLKGKDGISAAKPDTQRKATKAITDFKKYLSQFDKTIPDESDIEAYRVKSEATDGSKGYQATRTKITYIRGYFALNEERSKEATMTDETMREPEALGAVEPETVQASEETSQGVDDETSTENVQASEEPEAEITAPIEPESLPEPVNKRGRKRLDENGEIRKNKITVYLTDTQNADFEALCSLKQVRSAADYVLGLITAEISRNEEALAFFREARSKLK